MEQCLGNISLVLVLVDPCHFVTLCDEMTGARSLRDELNSRAHRAEQSVDQEMN